MQQNNEQSTNGTGIFQEVHVDRATGNVVEAKDDLQVRTIGTGRNKTKVLNFTLACNNYKREGQAQTASFLRVSAFGRDAEILGQYLTKGKPLTVRGRVELKSYESKKYFAEDGTPAIMTAAELRMEQNGFKFENGPRRAAASDAAGAAAQPAAEQVEEAPAAATKSRRSRSSKKSAGAPPAQPVDLGTAEQPGGPF